MQFDKLQNFFRHNRYFRTGSRYGLGAGIFSILAFILLLILDKNPLITNKYLDFLLIPLFVFFGVKEFRDYHNAGVLHFWEGMTTGFFTYMLAAVIMGTFIWVFVAIDTNLLKDYIKYSTQLIMDQKEGIVEHLGMDTFQAGLNNVKNIRPFDLATDDFLRKIIIGFAINVIIAIAMRQTYK